MAFEVFLAVVLYSVIVDLPQLALVASSAVLQLKQLLQASFPPPLILSLCPGVRCYPGKSSWCQEGWETPGIISVTVKTVNTLCGSVYRQPSLDVKHLPDGCDHSHLPLPMLGKGRCLSAGLGWPEGLLGACGFVPPVQRAQSCSALVQEPKARAWSGERWI